LDPDVGFGLEMALREMLMNAIEHGNLRIHFDKKTRTQARGLGAQLALNARLAAKALARHKTVHVRWSVEGTGDQRAVTFRIRDQGEGFDWRRFDPAATTENLTLTHGRGRLVARGLVDDMRYNEAG